MTPTASTAGASCGETLIRLLERHGVELTFGIPGVHTLELFRGLASSSIRHVTPRHEQGAGFMADGYARVSGRPGVCLLITGPGVTNVATAVASAYHDSQPLLIVSSDTDTRLAGRGRGPLHDLPDQQRFMATITASSETVLSPDELPAALERAFALLAGPRRRPVHVGIPIDVLSRSQPQESPDLPSAAPAVAADRRHPPSPDPRDLRRAAELLGAAQRPMIVLGGGAIDAGAHALAVSGAIGAPVATTLNGKGSIPEGHAAALGATLTLEPVYGALEAADVVLAVGTELSEVDYYYQADIPRFGGALIRIDSDPDQVESGRQPAVALVGDAAETLAELARRLPREADRSGEAAARARELRAGLRWWPGARELFPVLDAIGAALPPETIVVADSTQLAYVANAHLPVSRPRSYLAPAGFGTLGPALPMAIGAQLADRSRPVVCLIGDGGLLFTIQELATAVELELPIAIVLWQNHGYGEIRDSMDGAGVAHIGTDATARDYVAIAEGFGCRAVQVSSLRQVPVALRTAFDAGVSTVIELSDRLLR